MREIHLEDVDFSYDKKTVLKNFNLHIKGGGFTALLGANGAGKSTIFNLISGILAPDKGRVSVGGVDASNRLEQALKIGFVFQENTLDLELSVQQNIQYFAGLFGLKNYKAKSEKLLTEFDLWEQRTEKAGNLNGGHKRRLEIVRALMPSPEILILDEATNGLDPVIRQQMSKQIHLLADQGVGVLWVTHLLDEIEEQDSVILLEKGELRDQDSFFALGGVDGVRSRFTVEKEETLRL